MKISPKAIAKLLDLDLDLVIYKVNGKKADDKAPLDLYLKMLKAIRKDYKNVLFEVDKLPLLQIQTQYRPTYKTYAY